MTPQLLGGCVVNMCFIGFVLNENYLVETEDGEQFLVETENMGSLEEGDNDANTARMNNKEDNAESLLLNKLDEEDAMLFENLPSKKKKSLLKQVGKILATDGEGNDYKLGEALDYKLGEALGASLGEELGRQGRRRRH